MSEITSSNFPGTTLAPRRRKVAKACDFCREHRIRCEDATPCPPCRDNDVACRRSRSLHTPRKSPRKSIQRQNGRDADKQHPDGHSGDVAPTSSIRAVDTSIRSPSPSANLAWTSHKTDSILGFIARLNSFCSGVSQLHPGASPSDNDLSLDQISPFPSRVLEETRDADCDLSPAQIRHLLRIFWVRIRPLMPIMELKDLDPPSKHTPLQDAIVAFSLHYIYCSGLHSKLIGLDWPQFQARQSPVGMPYFQRCLSAVTRLATFAEPSLSAIQCYCYLTSYLLNLGYHQAAYNMVGLALRVAQSLNYLDARHRGRQVCQTFRRLWWTLIHLDFRCSRYVGKPVTINIDGLVCLKPSRESQDIHLSNGLLYHTTSMSLTAAALVVSGAMGHHDFLDGAVEPTQLEERAEVLSQNLFHIRNWRDQLPQDQPHFTNIHFEETDVPRDTELLEVVDDQQLIMEQSPIVTLLNTLLLLQYHNVIISLHRVFIQFPTYPLVPKSHPKADAHAATALNHALTMIRIAHQRMSVHDILHGLSELYQYQWNAVITIIGFLLAYPYCHRCSRAREHLSLALEIFDSAGSEDSTATRAAAQTRYLCGKVDTLVQILSLSQPTPAATMESQIFPQNQSSDSRSPLPQSEGTTPLPDLNGGEVLWPWADLINLDTWPTYCDEVSEAFMDSAGFVAPHIL
ncbi:hypothetical protein AbraIFM66951_005864 [Aspergillus brasiliensis]|uniref:Zn(2)-C6 fungal-type domain-containing protein n=1 Tax=Aspergillus brasiliensis TaxID=319629 RepID=A0A9W6DKF0_9EURO|nr:hypothetical protein AbraCBS73388_006117 [Aspergillus brasiliensis]GKZ44088.1 hypothetical protein AbraIFM66951_005864 [Aspergillus brasiliensis]